MILLSLKNIKERKFRTFLISLSVTIGTMSMIIFMGLNEGIKKATFDELEKNQSLNEITVRPKVESSKTLSIFKSLSEQRIETKDLEKIKTIEGVTNAYPETQFNEFTSLEVDIMGFSMITDAMIFGLEEGYLLDDIKTPDSWQRTEQPYPAIISRKLLDIYNFTIAIPQGLPTISEKNLIGKEMNMYPGFSTFFPGMKKKGDIIKLEVVGFSDKVNLIGATIPSGILESLNQKYAPKSKSQYLQVHVLTENQEKTPEVAKEIEKLNYSATYLLEQMKSVNAKFNYISYALGAISILILLTASLAIISTFLAQIAERIKELGLYRALGASKKNIKHLILIEAGLIGIIGSITGAIIGTFFSEFINTYISTKFQDFDIIPDTFIILNTKIYITVLIFGTLIALLSAYYPAHKAGKISPIQAISK